MFLLAEFPTRQAGGFLVLAFLPCLLAGLSIWTRKNSRHPLLLVGLVAFAILFLGYQWMSRSVRNSAWAQTQARAIVENVPAGAPPDTTVGSGMYVGLVAAAVLVLFGFTIVIKRVPRAYALLKTMTISKKNCSLQENRSVRQTARKACTAPSSRAIV